MWQELGRFLHRQATFAQIVFEAFKFPLQMVKFLVGKVFEIHEAGAGALHCAQQFIKLEVNGAAVAVLSILNQEDDEKSNDGCARVDDQLPGVRVMEKGANKSPDKNCRSGQDKCPGRTDRLSDEFRAELKASVKRNAIEL